MTRRGLFPGAWAALVVALAGCVTAPADPTASGSVTSPASRAPQPTSSARSGDVAVADHLANPWAVAFLPDGSVLLTQRADKQIRRLVPGGGQAPQPVGEIDEVAPAYEGGMLGLALSPGFATDGLVYVYVTTATDERIVRLHWDGTRLTRDRDILTGIPKGEMYHHGGRIAFGPDGLLYAGTGDAKRGELAQDTNSLAGKILRLNPDGTVPGDNPFGNPVWSYGHRNVQGLAWDARGQLLASELGEKAYDELNLIQKGRNYGWPVVEGPGDGGQGMAAPIATWQPTSDCSPSGISIVGDTVYVGCLAGQKIATVSWDGHAAGPPGVLRSDLGRVRDVTPGPDGRLWVLTDNGSDDRILTINP